jgi:hypothetical protein
LLLRSSTATSELEDLSGELLSWHDSAVKFPLPAALSSARQRAFGLFSTKMPDFLPFGFGGTMMIIACLGLRTRCMRRTHVVGLVRSTQFQRADVLDDPTLADTIDAPITDHADPASSFPNGKPHPR